MRARAGQPILDGDLGLMSYTLRCVTAIQNPIMISCAGRSGSTFFYRILARHRDLGWLSTYNQVLPSQAWLAVFSRLYGVPVFDRVKHTRYFPKPFSPYRFWGRYLPNVARHDRPLTAADVPDAAIEPLRRTIAAVLRYQGKPRFLMKVTGWARMDYFDRVFPEMRFIYLRRDPIAVMASWINAGWLNVTSEPETPGWEWGEVPPQYMSIWRELGGGPILSAALKTQLDRDDLRRNATMFRDRCFELDYENLVEDPMTSFRKTLDFCKLEWDREFEAVVKSTMILNYSTKWKKQIPGEEGERVSAFFQRAAEVRLLPSG